MATTTYSSLSQRTTAWAAKEMLAHAEPQLVLSKYGLTKPMPKNTAEQVKFRRPVPLALAKTPLTEGTPPTAKAMAYEDVPVTLSQYGDVVEITDVVADLAEDPVLKDASMLCGEQAAETIESLIWDVIVGGTNVYYANGAARNEVNTAISLNKQRAITRHLKAERAKKITQMVSSSVKYGTEAIDAAFIAFAHTDCEADIRNMTGFVPTEKYGSMKALPYEIGKVEDVRYIMTPVLSPIADAGGAAGSMVSTTGTSADIYPVVYVGKDAYGHVALKGANAIRPMIRNPGTIDSSDPLGQKGSVGWKTYHKAMILNQAWLCRLECAVTDLG
ncbi:MAG: N4-gp56 family major capsid protein [Halieaceae bacterium]|jgi:N4-gp56 family major capsid protein|nr:N4-gp56 family major capsid protein [Halieaceae bacterium]